ILSGHLSHVSRTRRRGGGSAGALPRSPGRPYRPLLAPAGRRIAAAPGEVRHVGKDGGGRPVLRR
ncbi:hypothetical protein, partial [Streptomyces sp. NPDC057496]|uniref:hypothetical protein n=1 Tax=Streptomyces sp. NPDC057496 TaxID=3346149 RepID=UPI003674CAEF